MIFKKILIFPLVILILLNSETYIKAETSETQKKIKVLAKAEIDAKGAILLDYNTGRVLWEKNSNTSLPMASTTKIMTAILAIEKGDLKDEVTVTKKASLAPKTKMNLVKDEKISLENLLYALMLESANDSAVAIAEHIGGSEENFCKLMTSKAKSLGAKNTLFETPNGLDKGNHHSTAYDMAVITRYALKNETFKKIISTKNISFKSSKKSYSLTNKNRLLSEYSGGIGVKTGFTGKAGHCFVGSAKRGDMCLISVVLASGWGKKGKERKWIDTKKILNYGFENFCYETPLKKGEIREKSSVLKSDKKEINLILKEGLTVCLKKDEEKIKIIKKVPKVLYAPIKAGDTLGTYEIYIDNKLYDKIDLIAEKSIQKKTFLEYFIHILKIFSLKNLLS